LAQSKQCNNTPAAAMDSGASSWLAMGSASATVTLLGISALASAACSPSALAASADVKKENSEALGPGFRAGFLGMLHMEVFMQRLEQEHSASVVTTTPTVTYILDFGQVRVNISSLYFLVSENWGFINRGDHAWALDILPLASPGHHLW